MELTAFAGFQLQNRMLPCESKCKTCYIRPGATGVATLTTFSSGKRIISCMDHTPGKTKIPTKKLEKIKQEEKQKKSKKKKKQ
jgi:hypothetical protein